jgi:hypothetical protein
MRSLIVVIAMCLLAGCSAFEREWEGEVAVGGTGLEGRWEGTWQSDVNGHNGGLRCIIASDEDGAYEAWYHATYGGFFTFEYKMPMEVELEGDTSSFSATADLGWLAGGIYEYIGKVVGDEYTATYKCKRDQGTFEMARVE